MVKGLVAAFLDDENPTYLASVLDRHANTLRHDAGTPAGSSFTIEPVSGITPVSVAVYDATGEETLFADFEGAMTFIEERLGEGEGEEEPDDG